MHIICELVVYIVPGTNYSVISAFLIESQKFETFFILWIFQILLNGGTLWQIVLWKSLNEVICNMFTLFSHKYSADMKRLLASIYLWVTVHIYGHVSNPPASLLYLVTSGFNCYSIASRADRTYLEPEAFLGALVWGGDSPQMGSWPPENCLMPP